MNKNSKKIDLLIELFIDSIKYATSKTNLSIKINKILERFFTYNIVGELGKYSGKKSIFSEVLFSRQKYYSSESKILLKNANMIVLNFYYKNYTITQTLYLDNLKINYFSEVVSKNKSKQKGGQGYSVMVEDTPIAGKPVIRSYYDCCRPVFSGGKADSGYYLDVGGNHLVVQPQYRAY
jgi:hypothetical protein